MKKTLALAAAIVLAGQISNAQTQKGKQTLSINANYNDSKRSDNTSQATYSVTQENKYTNLSIGPSYGYFVADGLELGGSLSYNYARQTSNNYSYPNTNISESKNNSFGVSAYFRKYVLYKNKVGFRTGPYATYQWGKNDYGSIPGTAFSTKSTGYVAGANFDLVYYPTERFGVAATIANVSYSSNKSNVSTNVVDNHTNDHNFAARFFNSGLALSVFYTFGGI